MYQSTTTTEIQRPKKCMKDLTKSKSNAPKKASREQTF